MSDSVEVRVTADISDLKAQLAEAQANVKQFSAAVDRLTAAVDSLTAAADSLTAAAKTYGSQASIEAQLQKDQAALDEARSKVNQLASDIKTIEAPAQQAAAAVEGIAPAAGHGRTATAGMAREFIVLGHEVVSGNFSRIPGSLMVLAERTGGLSAALAAITPEIVGIGAAVITVTGLFAAWAIQAYKVESAIRGASIAAVEAGRSGPGARQQIEQGGQQIQTSSGGSLSNNQSTMLAASINQLGELTDEQKAKVNDLAAAFAAMFQGNVDATEKFIAKTFESDAALKSYLDRYHLLGADGQRAWDSTTDAAQRFDIGIQAISARLGPLFDQYRQRYEQATAAQGQLATVGALGGMAPLPNSVVQPSPETRGNIPDQSSALIDNTAAQLGVTQAIANFATRIAEVESHGQQIGGPGSVAGAGQVTTSRAGALGMMQVMPDVAGGTTRTVGGQTYDLTDQVQNVKAGLAILADLFRQFGGDQYKVAVAYNAGPRVATGQVQQSPANQQQTADYTQRLGLSQGPLFLPNMGEGEPGTTGDAAAERSQRITDENDYQVKISQIDAKLADQQKQLGQDEAAVAAASQMAAGQERDAAMAAANARVQAVQRSIAALTEEKAMVRSPADAGVARQAEQQISTAKLANDQKDSDPKQRAIDDANAEVAAYQQAAQAVGISEAAKQEFAQKTEAAQMASINAVRAAEGDWAAQQQAQVLQIEAKEAQAGGDRQEIELRTTAAVKAYWQSVVQSTTLTTDQRRQAESKLAEVTIRYAEQSATAAKEAQDKRLRATEARANAEVAAERGSVAAVVAAEQEKVDAVRAVHGAESAEYFTALEQQTNAVRTAVQEQVRAESEAGKQSIADKAANLKAEADAHQITKQQEMQQLLTFVEGERDAELGALTNLLGTLAQGTAAYKAAYDARVKLAQQFQTELDALHAKEVQAAQAATDQTTKAYQSMFASIGSSGNRAIEGLITGHMSWLKAAQTVDQGIINSMLSLVETLLARWTAYEAAKLLQDQATTTAMNTAQAANGASSGWPQMLTLWAGYLGQKLGLTTAAQATENSVVAAGQVTQTAATTAGAATRAAADSGAGMSAQLAQVVARWSATEATKTALTTGGAATRATADSGAGLSTDLSQVLARWSATEASKTALTTGGAATRATADSGSQLTSELAQVVARWSATEASKTALTTTGAATRATADSGAQVTAEATQIVARWTATEAAKTAATTAGASVRATADSGGGFLSEIAQVLARWLGLETAKTATTATQAAARQAAETAYNATALATTGTMNVAEAMSYAAVGAAAAGASVAAIPYVGWAMAPGVEASTYATLVGFASMASLAVGTDNVPKDMVAQIHQGEMVVPAAAASQLRSNSVGGSSLSSMVMKGQLPPQMGLPSNFAMPAGAANQNFSTSNSNSTSNTGGNTLTANFSPTYNGAPGGAAGQSNAAFNQYRSWFGNTFRNGNLTPARTS